MGNSISMIKQIKPIQNENNFLEDIIVEDYNQKTKIFKLHQDKRFIVVDIKN